MLQPPREPEVHQSTTDAACESPSQFDDSELLVELNCGDFLQAWMLHLHPTNMLSALLGDHYSVCKVVITHHTYSSSSKKLEPVTSIVFLSFQAREKLYRRSNPWPSYSITIELQPFFLS